MSKQHTHHKNTNYTQNNTSNSRKRNSYKTLYTDEGRKQQIVPNTRIVRGDNRAEKGIASMIIEASITTKRRGDISESENVQLNQRNE